MNKRMGRPALLVAVLLIFLGFNAPFEVGAGAAEKTLWDRLGGEKNVNKIVADFQKAAGADPKVNATRGGKFKLDEAGKKERQRQFVAFLSSVTGGPLKYTGRSMKDAHKGLGITKAEFDATVPHFKMALEKNGVAAADVSDTLRIWNATRKDIVEGKK